MLTVLKAGAAFLPLDIADPALRIASILSITNTKIVLTSEAQLTSAEQQNLPCFLVSEAASSEWLGSSLLSPVIVKPSDAAYVIFTLGITRTLKGILVEYTTLLTSIRE